MQLLRLSYRVPLDAFYRFNADDGWAIASHIALSTLMSLFPFLILCTALAGFLGSKDLADEVANILLEAWPTQVATPIAAEIHNVLTTARGDLLTIGALLAVYFSSSGIESLKLYYMIGLPTEDDADLVAIRDLTMQLHAIMLKHARARGRIGRIVASVNPLVPKPGTAYQWLPMAPADDIERKMKRMRALVADIDNVYFNIKSERHSYYQGLLSLGDRRVADVIERAEANGGQWRAAVADAGLDADAYLYRDKSGDAFLPWQIIDGGMKESFFRAEMDKSLRAEWTVSGG